MNQKIGWWATEFGLFSGTAHAFSRAMRVASSLTTEATPILQYIEVASSLQIPNFHVIGLPAQEVAEARERVRAAITASGFEFPKRRVVMNLSPASIRKSGTGADLAMALAVLESSTHSGAGVDDLVVASGELGLDGRIKPVGQVMRTLYASWRAGATQVLLSPQDYQIAVGHLALLAECQEFLSPPPLLSRVETLSSAVQAMINRTGSISIVSPPIDREPDAAPTKLLPLMPYIARIVCVAASGRHHLLLLGPKGTGKSHAMDWFGELLPPPCASTKVQSILIEELARLEQSANRSVRRVSSQVKPAALVGSATAQAIKPGEFSLAHGGCLFADELPEWSRDSKETFREPLERGILTLTRVNAACELPARFTLVASGNLCACGGWPKGYPAPFGSVAAPCVCPPGAHNAYAQRLSGPILDRIDLVALVLNDGKHSEKAKASASVQELKEKTREADALATQLYGSPAGLLSAGELERFLQHQYEWQAWLKKFRTISLRSRHKITRVALSLAIWDYVFCGAETPAPTRDHFEEARCYRPEALKFLAQEAYALPMSL